MSAPPILVRYLDTLGDSRLTDSQLSFVESLLDSMSPSEIVTVYDSLSLQRIVLIFPLLRERVTITPSVFGSRLQQALLDGEISADLADSFLDMAQVGLLAYRRISYSLYRDPVVKRFFEGAFESTESYDPLDLNSNVLDLLDLTQDKVVEVATTNDVLLFIVAWYGTTSLCAVETPGLGPRLERLLRSCAHQLTTPEEASQILRLTSFILRKALPPRTDNTFYPYLQVSSDGECITALHGFVPATQDPLCSEALEDVALHLDHLTTIIALGSVSALKTAVYALQTIFSVVLELGTAFIGPYLLLLDSIETTSLHLAIPAFQRFYRDLCSCFDADIGTAVPDFSSVIYRKQRLTCALLHRALHRAVYPIRRFYVHILPLLSESLAEDAEPLCYPAAFLAYTYLPATMNAGMYTFHRCATAREKIIQERRRVGPFSHPEPMKVPTDLFAHATIRLPEMNYEAKSFLDRDIESVFPPLTDKTFTQLVADTDVICEDICIAYYAHARQYNKLCFGSPLVTDATVFQAGLMRFVIFVLKQHEDPHDVIKAIATILSNAKSYTMLGPLYAIMAGLQAALADISVSEDIAIGSGGGSFLGESRTLMQDDIASGMVNLYASISQVSQYFRPLLLGPYVNLSIMLSAICSVQLCQLLEAVYTSSVDFQLSLTTEVRYLMERHIEAIFEDQSDPSSDQQFVHKTFLIICLANHSAVDVPDSVYFRLSSALVRHIAATLDAPDAPILSLLASTHLKAVYDSVSNCPMLAESLVGIVRVALATPLTPIRASRLTALITILYQLDANEELNTLYHELRAKVQGDDVGPFVLSSKLFTPLRAVRWKPDDWGLTISTNMLTLTALDANLQTNIQAFDADAIQALAEAWSSSPSCYLQALFICFGRLLGECRFQICERCDILGPYLDAFRALFRVVYDLAIDPDPRQCGHLLHLAAEFIYSADVLEVMYGLHLIQNSAIFDEVYTLFKRFCVRVYTFIYTTSTYAHVLGAPLMRAIQAFFSKATAIKLRSTFICEYVLDVVLIFALFVPNDHDTTHSGDIRTIATIGYSVDSSVAIGEVEVPGDVHFADYRLRISALTKIQYLASIMGPLLVLIRLLKWAGAGRSPECLAQGNDQSFRVDPRTVSQDALANLFTTLLVPLLEYKPRLFAPHSIAQRQQDHFVKLIRMLASMIYHSEREEKNLDESQQKTILNLVNIIDLRLMNAGWGRTMREVLEQACALLLLATHNPVTSAFKTLGNISADDLFGLKPSFIQSRVIVASLVIKCTLDGSLDIIVAEPDSQLHLRSLLRIILPCAICPVHSIRSTAQSLFCALDEIAIALDKSRQSSIVRSILTTIGVSPSLLFIFKSSLTQNEVQQKYGSILDALDPRSTALKMVLYASHYDTAFPLAEISAVDGNVLQSIEEAYAYVTSYAKIYDMGEGGGTCLRDITYSEVEPTCDYIYQQKILQVTAQSISDAGKKSPTLTGSLIINASLLSKTTNLGGLARTAEVFQLEALVLSDLSCTQDKMFRTMSATADRWLHTEAVPPLQLIEWMRIKRAEGYTLVGLEQSNRSVLLEKARLPERAVLILGNENKGCPDEVLQECDQTIEIPQFGQVRSLNVHVSCAIFVWEWVKQHRLGSQQ
ncbi:tRNA guanosine-2'-O-methyltransferase [Giardia muris]|uniref:tRNA guanosine-2'-O-methyltransferase n=1 Tax=Giardia muris TaxID=5742 RepID=A0A4Z1SXI4_GIAMU|nr:tRNA guanosine-2'-O-methyltransferase [Giardia muris]|eukprot:TNJ30434.1 tRNA guanosine-2'-O-methyltransferase [Giardia muris]